MDEQLIREGFSAFDPYETWYRVHGELDGGMTPIVCLHGGPGFSHDYIENFADLTRGGWPVVFYDQIGTGRSTNILDVTSDFWSIDLFKAQLRALLDDLGIASNFILLGQSWGVMLATEFTLERPDGLRALILSNGLASSALWQEEATVLVSNLPEQHRHAIQSALESGDFSSPEFEQANAFYLSQHGCRLPEPPAGLVRSSEFMSKNPAVYTSMWGASEFVVTGSLKEWSITQRLGGLEYPTLVVGGRHDEATPRIQEQIHAEIKGSQLVIMENSSHMPFYEEREAYFDVLLHFLEALAQ